MKGKNILSLIQWPAIFLVLWLQQAFAIDKHWSINAILILVLFFTTICLMSDKILWYFNSSLTGLLLMPSLFILPFRYSTGIEVLIIIAVVLYFINSLWAGFELYDGYKQSKEYRNWLVGDWGLTDLFPANDHAQIKTTTIFFSIEGHGKCEHFYDIRKFKYKVTIDDMPKLKIRADGKMHTFGIQIQFDETGDEVLRIGEPFAFDDEFRGYHDPEKGLLTLVIEPIYTFKRVSIID